MHHIARAALATICLAAAAAHAQGMKPGLWEVTQKLQSASGQMEQALAQAQQQLASLPPEQRKKVQEMMARQGVSMGGPTPGAMGMRMCITREMAERAELPVQQQGDCRSTTSGRSGNTMKMTFSCSNPPSSGEGQLTFSSPEAYTMKMVVNTVVQGRPEKMNMDASGRWLGADCGSVRPMAPAPGR